MHWQMKSLIITGLGVELLFFGYLIETLIHGSCFAVLFAAVGFILALMGLLHFCLNTIATELEK